MPCFIAPRVGFLYKEVGGKTNIECHPGWQLELSVASPLYGQGEVLRTENVRSVKAALAIKKVHIAMRTALAHLVATMPGIPDDHSYSSFTFKKETCPNRQVPLHVIGELTYSSTAACAAGRCGVLATYRVGVKC